MENSSPTSLNTNTKTTSDTDGFSIPVSTNSPSPTTTISPTVTDFSSPSSSSSDSLFNTPPSPSSFGSGPMSSLDTNKDSSKSQSPVNPKLSAPIHGQNYSSRKNSKSRSMALGVVLVVILLVCVYGVYSWQHSKVTKLTTSNSTLSTTVTSLEAQLNNADKNLTADQAIIDSNTVSVPTLGFSLSVPSSLKDLTIAPKANPTKITVNNASVTPTEVNLSSTSLAALDSACSTANGALGVLSKTSGQYPTSPTSANSSGTIVEQFTTYYIAYTPPTACSKTASVNTSQSSLVSELQATLIRSNITLTE